MTRIQMDVPLSFGKFAGKTVPQILFIVEGYDYLHDWIMKEMKMDRWENKKGHTKLELDFIQEVLKTSKKIPVKAKCQYCDNTSQLITFQGNSDIGYNPDSRFCINCKDRVYRDHKTITMRIDPTSIKHFHQYWGYKNDQAVFLTYLRSLYGFPKRLTQEFLNNLFFEINPNSLYWEARRREEEKKRQMELFKI
jgi:hypothetical protein